MSDLVHDGSEPTAQDWSSDDEHLTDLAAIDTAAEPAAADEDPAEEDSADEDWAAELPERAAGEPDEVVPATGDARVDDALGRLGDLTGLPVEEHLAVYEDVHRRLHDALADLDER